MGDIKVRVFHDYYGCESGCFGHTVELTLPDGKTQQEFDFIHPFGEDAKMWALELAKKVIVEKWPACASSIDWASLVIEVTDGVDAKLAKTGEIFRGSDTKAADSEPKPVDKPAKRYAIWFQPASGHGHWVEADAGERWEGTQREARYIIRECERIVRKGTYSLEEVKPY